jgi:hypothetical protein
VVPVDESEVYETVLPMCGPDYHRSGLDGGSTDGESVRIRRLLSRLPVPNVSDCVSSVLERLGHVSRRI